MARCTTSAAETSGRTSRSRERSSSLLGKPESLIRPVADRQGHDRRYSLDCSKLQALGFSIQTDLDEALARTVSWYRENERWWRSIKEKSAEYRAYYEKQYGSR